MADLLGEDEVEAAVDGPLSSWTLEDDTLVRTVESNSFAAGIQLVDEVAVVADEMDHHPDIDVRYTAVTFRLSTHSAGGLTENDLTLARKIDAISGG